MGIFPQKTHLTKHERRTPYRIEMKAAGGHHAGSQIIRIKVFRDYPKKHLYEPQEIYCRNFTSGCGSRGGVQTARDGLAPGSAGGNEVKRGRQESIQHNRAANSL